LASQVIGNFAQIQAALLAIIPRVAAADKVVEESAAHIVAGLAAAKAPVLTGELRASIGEEGAEVVVDSDHGFFQEYGTRRMKAQPFLRPAKDEAEPIVKILAEEAYTAATR
jgi:HK97 gp10 family phage protein